jgi:dTDP-4-dehydrorhamnose reductase
MEMLPTFITGTRGLLGTTLMKVIGETGLRPVAFQGDVRDAPQVAREIVKAAPKYIVHAAAMTDVITCEREPERAYAVNAKGTGHILEAARSVGAHVLFVSTASVFKGDKGNYREDDAPAPFNTYNRSKREGELQVLQYEKGVVLRLNVIGIHPSGSRGRNFLEWLADSFRANRDMTLFDDIWINPLSNWTVATLIARILRSDAPNQIVHIGSRDVLSKAEIGELVKLQFPQYRGCISCGSAESMGDGVVRPKQMWLNTEAASAMLGSMPTIAQELEKIFNRLKVVSVH